MKYKICLPWNVFSFFATRAYLWGNLLVRLASQPKSLRKFNLPPLATTCWSVWPGLKTRQPYHTKVLKWSFLFLMKILERTGHQIILLRNIQGIHVKLIMLILKARLKKTSIGSCYPTTLSVFLGFEIDLCGYLSLWIIFWKKTLSDSVSKYKSGFHLSVEK